MSPTQSLSLNTWSSNGSVLNCSLLPFLGIFFFSHFLTLVALTKLVMNKTVKKNFGKVQCWQCQQQIWCFLLKVLYWRAQFFTPCGSMNSCFSISYLYHHLWLELNNYISNSWLGFLSLDHRDSALTLFFFLPLVIYPINVANYAWTFLVITWRNTQLFLTFFYRQPVPSVEGTFSSLHFFVVYIFTITSCIVVSCWPSICDTPSTRLSF